MSFSRRPELVALGVFAGLAVIVAVVLGAACRSTPALTVTATPAVLPAVSGAVVPWPSQGSAALGLLDVGMIGSNNDAQAVPLASVTKVMTALVVLDDHALKPGESGPTITISHDDVAEFLREAGEDQSVVGVEEGETITELQLLQGLLIPSGNNFADLLARWDAGSLPAFVQKMNARAATLGMMQTKYGDASGILPSSVGSAADQVRLGMAAMQNPAFAAIVAMSDVALPFAGTVHTTNTLLGTHGVIGLKTGNTDEAGGCLLFAAKRQFGDRQQVVIGAVLKQPALQDAFTASAALVDATPNIVQAQVVLPAGTTVGAVSAPWGGNSSLQPKDGATLLIWPGAPVHMTNDVKAPHAPISAGAEVGTATVVVGDQSAVVHLVVQRAIGNPGFLWRVFRH